jgi:4-hydroxybenzoate polyprenyltransferase
MSETTDNAPHPPDQAAALVPDAASVATAIDAAPETANAAPTPAVASPSAPSLWTRVVRRLDAYDRLARLDKPIGILLLLWPTLWALWIAGDGAPPLAVLAIYVLGTVLMRAAGCCVNDWADRDFDAEVERTRNRPLAKGEIRPWEALVLAAVLALLAFLLIQPLNALTKLLSVPALLIAITYPFTKRFFSLPQAYLGIAFSFGIPMAFATLTGGVPPIGWLLFAANFFWIIAYDTEYALADYPDDVRIGMRTSAITFGRFVLMAIMLCYALAIMLLGVLGAVLKLGSLYFGALLVATALAAYHLWLIRDRDRQRAFKAFLHNNWFGLTVFAGIAADYAWRLGAWPRAW